MADDLMQDLMDSLEAANIRQRAVEVAMAESLGPNLAALIVDALAEAGLLSEPCRHEPMLDDWVWCDLRGSYAVGAHRLATGDSCPGPHRTLFVEQEEGGP